MPHKTVLILGATKGLGAWIQHQYQNRLEEEWHTIGAGRSIDGVIYPEAPPASDRMRTLLYCDLQSSESVTVFLKGLGSFAKEVDHFYWVAGRLLKAEFASHSSEEILATITTNFTGALPIAQEIWSQMQKSPSGKKSFSVIASSSGIRPRNDEAVYVATKHAQVGFTRSLGLENKNPNVRVSLFLPGGMQTPFWLGHSASAIEYGLFLDPEKVAKHIVNAVMTQDKPYLELEIPRGSL